MSRCAPWVGRAAYALHGDHNAACSAFPAPCRLAPGAKDELGAAQVTDWEQSKAADDVRVRARNLDLIGLENLAHGWRVDAKTSAVQAQDNDNAVGARGGNPVLRIKGPFGQRGDAEFDSEYWGAISGGPGATEPNLLEQRWRLFHDIFGETTRESARGFSAGTEPTVGTFLSEREKAAARAANGPPQLCAANGRGCREGGAASTYWAKSPNGLYI